MHFEVASCGEAAEANWALIGSFSCVRAEMDLQGRITAEHFSTKATAMLETASGVGAGCRGRVSSSRDRLKTMW